jgi:sugar phosphate isomerase/epimerase|tara:strand:- start:1244 stop:2011 length:768 start_codon:yes stop_codon:yes gene_type:complete
MLYTGLCSITLRNLSVSEIIKLAQQAGLDGIEWGAEPHVPAGDLEEAESVKNQTITAGLNVCSYGSYYRATDSDAPFADVLDSAVALGAPVIRIWAGNTASAETSQSNRDTVAEHIRRAVIAAREVDITIALEYHGNTLTDTQESAHRLLKEVGLPDLTLYWQPRAGGAVEEELEELNAALPHLSHVHCFHWGPGGWTDRHPLLDGVNAWESYLNDVQAIEGDRSIILEFVKDDAPEQLLEDAKVLKALVQKTSS